LAPGSHLGKRTDVEAPLGAPHSATGRSGRASPSSPIRSSAVRACGGESARRRDARFPPAIEERLQWRPSTCRVRKAGLCLGQLSAVELHDRVGVLLVDSLAAEFECLG
jgi:hypothetical protein